MKAYTGHRSRSAAQYNGQKRELCYHWKLALVKWCRRLDRREARKEIAEQLR